MSALPPDIQNMTLKDFTTQHCPLSPSLLCGVRQNTPLGKNKEGQGATLILDCVGATMYEENLKAIRLDGRWIIYGSLGGLQVNADMSKLLAKRVSLLFTTLRFRSIPYKANLVSDFTKLSIPLFENGSFQPIIQTSFLLKDIAAAHSMMESNQNLGKIVLNVREDDTTKEVA